MPTHKFERRVTVPVPVERLWEWHMAPGAFERLAPPWQRIEPVDLPESPAEGARAVFRLRKGPFSIEWRAVLGPVEPPYRFVDTQESGPFGAWRHEHRFAADGARPSVLTDSVTYALPAALGWLPGVAKPARGELERLFRFRHRRMSEDLARFPGELPGPGRTVLVSGSRGLIGSRLVPFLKTLGYTVRGLTRGRGGEGLFHWDPGAGKLDPAALEDVDAVIHLAGENIASGRWTAGRRERILNSRVDGTRTLVEAMGRAKRAPAVLVSASGVNYYPSGSGTVDESSSRGKGFLSEVCERWEAEAMRARGYGIRTVCLRTGVVLDPAGGALAKMLPAFHMGLGGPIGPGRQRLPWIGMDDLLDIYERAMRDSSFDGAVNAVHPQIIEQRRFAKTLGSILRRPAVLPLPEWAVKGLFGKMGEETLLADLAVKPRFLEEGAHPYRHASLEDALAFMLGKAVPSMRS